MLKSESKFYEKSALKMCTDVEYGGAEVQVFLKRT